MAIVLLAAETIRALAVTPRAIVSAANRHSTFVLTYLAGSLVCIAVAFVLAGQNAPLPLMLALLIPAELTQTIPAFRSALALLESDLPSFLRSLVSRQRLTDVADLWRFLRGRSLAS